MRIRAGSKFSRNNSMLEFVFFVGCECGRDHFVIGSQNDLAARNQSKPFGNCRIDLISNSDPPKLLLFGAGSGGNGTKEYPVKSPVGVPPRRVFFLLQGSLYVTFGFLYIQSRPCYVECHHFPARISEEKQITTREVPKGCRPILDCRCMPRGHERLKCGDFREQRGRTRQLKLQLLL